MPIVKLPICFDAQGVAKIMRDVLQELKFKFEREKTEKHYTQIMAVVPLPKFAYAFRFIVKSPSLLLDLYDAKITHSGMMHFLDVEYENLEDLRKVLDKLIQFLPREPWRFTIWQKIQCGILTPEIVFAKKKWKRVLSD